MIYIESTCQSSSVPSDEFVPLISKPAAQSITDEDNMEMSSEFCALFRRNVSLFYLKLQGQFLLPASTIQNNGADIQFG